MKRIYITVDVECHDIDLVNNYIWGRVGDQEYGLRCILEQGKKHNIPINFFFDMCEAKRYGDDYAKSIINAIEEYSQPIYLHLHPNYLLFGIYYPPGTPLDSSILSHEISLSIWPTTILSGVVVFTTMPPVI